MIKTIFAFLLVGVCATESARAASIVNPISRHNQYQSYGLFFDPQSMLLVLSGGRGWGAIGGATALVEYPESKYRTQINLHASANVAYAFSTHAGGTLYTQTIDARVGLAFDFEFTEKSRGSIIWTHQSGHIADNVPDLDLIGPDLGNEMIDFRYVHDINRQWRIGGGFRPFVISKPIIPAFGAHQFVEWYPLSANESRHHFVPFVAVGLEEYGVKNVDLNAHIQMGVVAGDHFGADAHQAIRLVVGGYNGVDPRLKYFQYKRRHDRFAYAGVAFEF